VTHYPSNKVNIELNSVMKWFVTYLQNPYKSQCSYYDTNQNPFNSVSYKDCVHKCFEINCFIKYKCVNPNYEYVIRRSDESSFHSKVKCNENELKNCYNIMSKKCIKICSIECLREEHYFTSYITFDENTNLKFSIIFGIRGKHSFHTKKQQICYWKTISLISEVYLGYVFVFVWKVY
jgi:hypothetical protein